MKLNEVAKKPSGIYVAATFSKDTIKNLKKLQKQLKLENPLDDNDFHTTIVHSTKPIEWENKEYENVAAKPVKLEIWEMRSGKNCIVLLIKSKELSDRFKEAKELGAKHDFPNYKPHISLSYDVDKDYEIDKDIKLDFDIELDHEYSEELDQD